MTRPLKIFDLHEANAILPQLETLLKELEDKQQDFRRLQDMLFFEELLEEIAPPEEKIQQLEETLIKLEQEISQIRELGCILRHPEKGLVDFLGRRGEEWIYYCWRRGEEKVQFYHTLRGGFFERQPLNC